MATLDSRSPSNVIDFENFADRRTLTAHQTRHVETDGRSVDGKELKLEEGLFNFAQLALKKSAYAMRVCGDIGHPTIREGEFIVIEPHLKAAPTDRVVVALKDGRTMLQELLVDRPKSITLRSLDGATRRTIQRNELRSVFGVQVVTSIVSARLLAKPPLDTSIHIPAVGSKFS
ncbi:S24 family peptidase [Hydrogenophaga sp.]|uniref:S24 family peptidase n=1 Tax=Hydrogenophaga sp. TaxID=1904254 RepID=UPI0025C5DB68|nr:S24 family peptidase [Hydrogenophaga sp.]MBT9462531.1 S24 family peptidase [Hydrogenophaga sp.]